MLSHHLKEVFKNALNFTCQKSYEYLTVDTLWYELLKEKDVSEILSLLDVDVEKLKSELAEYLEKSDQFSTVDKKYYDFLKKQNSGAYRHLGLLEGEKEDVQTEDNQSLPAHKTFSYIPELSMGLIRSLEKTFFQLHSSGKSEIKPIHLMVAFLEEEQTFTMGILSQYGINKAEVLNVVAHSYDQAENYIEGESELLSAGEDSEQETSSTSAIPAQRKKEEDIAQKYLINFNQLALEKKIEPLIGRSVELENIIQILSRKNKFNPILVGDAGVGKTAIIKGLAKKIVEKDIYSKFHNAHIYSLNMAQVLAGTRYRGDFEARLKKILEFFKNQKGEVWKILFIDEIHTIVGAGAVGGGAMDAANLMKPYLSDGEVYCIGCTTHKEYNRFIDSNKALMRRFQKINIKEPSSDETLKILKGLIPHFESFHKVHYTDNAIKKAIQLCDRYINEKNFPDKAIDVIDEAGAYVSLKRQSKIINSQIIDKVISQMANIPLRSLSHGEKFELKNLDNKIKSQIFGQNHVVEKVVSAIRLSRLGLTKRDGPMASLLFTGPTGVGKTELSKVLAKEMNMNFIRFDMSEYMEKHSVSKLIGAPPGYVGHEDGGLLTDSVKKNPYTVLLLDEIEKAHSDIYNILLQIMDYGKLTDSQGSSTDFKNVVLILTSNIGAKEAEMKSIALTSQSETGADHKMKGAIKRFFSPEFRNRLDGIMMFHSLGEEMIVKVVKKFIDELSTQLLMRKVKLIVSDDAYSWIARKAYDKQLGARPIKRYIEDHITQKISHLFLEYSLKSKDKIKIYLEDNQLKITK